MDTFITVISYLGAFFISVVTAPEVYSVLRTKKTAHLSLLLFTFLLLGCLCFVISGVYGCAKSDDQCSGFSIAVIIANTISGIFTAIIVFNKLVNRHIAAKKNIAENAAAELRRKKK